MRPTSRPPKPIFEAIGKTITHCGPHGAGQVVKACNQIVVALTIEAVSEALVLGSKAGVRPEIILEVLGGGLAGNKVMEVRKRNFLDHDFAPGFKIKLHRKDLGIILATAREYGVALPVTALVNEMFTTLVNEGRQEEDHSALLSHLERAVRPRHRHALGDLRRRPRHSPDGSWRDPRS